MTIHASVARTDKYAPGQKEIPEIEFEKSRVPPCPSCEKETCDFFIYKGLVDVEAYCSDECAESARLNKEREERKWVEEQRRLAAEQGHSFN
jgi:hypothetical protein